MMMKKSNFRISRYLPVIAIGLCLGVTSCGGPDNTAQMEQEKRDSIERAKAAMDAAREAALIKARMEDSLEQLRMTDSLEVSEAE